MKAISRFLSILALAASWSNANAAGEAQCLGSRDRAAGVKTIVVNSGVQMDTSTGWVEGLSNKFCVFTSSDHIGMIDLHTLTSNKPSIAATYLLRGLDMSNLQKVIPAGYQGNPATLFCQALAGSSVTRYTSGGFSTKQGQDEVCVFGDGSQMSTWSLVYASDDPGYLSMRKAVRSQPLSITLPYQK